jgi:ribosomal protein S18 acetylase RimI-like enzyme
MLKCIEFGIAMTERLRPVSDLSGLRQKLAEDILEHAHFCYRVFASGQRFECYADEDLTVALGVSEDGKDVVYAGNWQGHGLPDVLPSDGFFLSACPSGALELIKRRFEVVGEWPCWYYLTPEHYEPGRWDVLGSLILDDVPFVSKYWELTDEPEEHIRRKVAEFDSVCVRVGGKPVSWVGLHYEIEGVANMGFAHTLKEQRRKGYAQAVTKAIVNRLAKRGVRCTCHVIKDNKESIALCKRLGFTRIGEATWADIGKPLE